jgi:hypothetical protein
MASSEQDKNKKQNDYDKFPTGQMVTLGIFPAYPTIAGNLN